jgi:hypothetical protein
MPAPVQHIHLEPRRIGKLDEKNPVAGNGAHRREIGLASERVKGVEDEPDGRDGWRGAPPPRRRGSR